MGLEAERAVQQVRQLTERLEEACEFAVDALELVGLAAASGP